MCPCLSPGATARLLCRRGYTEHATIVSSSFMQELPYGRSQGCDTKDAVRFYTLVCTIIGIVRNRVPDQLLIAQGTDWRFPPRDEERAERGGNRYHLIRISGIR